MAGAAWPAIVATIIEKSPRAHPLIPPLEGVVAPIAYGAIVGVPLLVALVPRWAGRLATPLLALTSVGVYLTVPDTEHVIKLMPVAIVVAIVFFAAGVRAPFFIRAAVAFAIVGAAIADSAGRGAPIIRATGCFGVLLALPLVSWINRLRATRRFIWLPSIEVIAITHCLVLGFSSRVLIRQESVGLVGGAVGGALLVAVAVLVATARPVAVEP